MNITNKLSIDFEEGRRQKAEGRSGATPLGATDASGQIPLGAKDASGRTPRRRQAQGNADQEREC